MAEYKSIYQTNEVMRLIGKQNDFRLLNRDFYAALDAHRAAGNEDKQLFNVALHFFLLGIICGKRQERAAKGHKEYKPILSAEPKPQ